MNEISRLDRDRALNNIASRMDRATQAEAQALRLPFLHRLHPLVKLGAALVVLVALLFVTDPVVLAAVIALNLGLLQFGSRMRLGVRLWLLFGVPALVFVLSITLGIWIDPRNVADTERLISVGNWTFYAGAWREGATTALRLVALFVVALVGGSTTSGNDLVRSLVQHLRIPYRFGYAGLVAFRFVPRFRAELAGIRAAQQARGITFGRGPIGWSRRQLTALVPLMAGAFRHAERVALAMDARGFGFARTRTERVRFRFSGGDAVFAAVYFAAHAVAVALVYAF